MEGKVSTNEILREAVRNMSIHEFVSEKFMEAILSSAVALDKDKDLIRRNRKTFEYVAGRWPWEVGRIMDRATTEVEAAHLFTGTPHSGDTARAFCRYIQLALAGGQFSSQADLVLKLHRG